MFQRISFLKNIQEHGGTINTVSEIRDHKPESKNKIDYSISNVTKMKNTLTVLGFCGWNRRTGRVLEAWRMRLFGFLREKQADNRSAKKGTRVNENSFHLFCPNLNCQHVRRYKSLKSDLWHVRKVRRHLMFQKISFLKSVYVGIERTANGTARRSFLIGRTIRKLGGQMFI